MPSKKKKYNARFPAGRIKKIMQSDEEIGKVAQAVPVIISRTLELFVESLLTKTLKITNSRNAKTLSTSHMKQCIMSEQRFDFLRELVKNIPDISVAEEAANYNEEDAQSSPDGSYPDSDTPFDLSMPSTSTRATRPPPPPAGSHFMASNNNGTPHSQYKSQRSHSQNGSSSTAELEVNKPPRPRLGRLSMGSGAASTSVIMHTAQATSSSSRSSEYVQPLKLTRSESTPANAAQSCWQVAAQSTPPPPPPQMSQRHQRLKHQSQSMPCNNANNCSTPIKRQKLEPQPTPPSHTACIPAPIFSYDLCNKPVVKIDYSNLPLATAAGGVTTPVAIAQQPLSAPPSSAAFNFNAAAPIINIDLSSIVANVENNKPGITPPVATISIGPLPTTGPTLSNAPTPVPTSTPLSILPDSKVKAENIASSNSKSVAAAAAAASASAAAVQPSTSTASSTLAKSKNANSCFELDEDYDNI